MLADRVDRRALLIAGNVARALLMLALAAVAQLDLPIVAAPLLAGLATAAGVAEPSSVATTTARLVAPEDLRRASAARAAIGQGAIVAGPALGAAADARRRPAVAILVNAATFFALRRRGGRDRARPVVPPRPHGRDGRPCSPTCAPARRRCAARRSRCASSAPT